MALMQLTVVPLGESVSVGDFVAEFQRQLALEDVEFSMNDMGTVVVGEVSELLAVAAKIHQIPFAKGVKRVLTQISIDDRRDKDVRLGDKVRVVQERLRGDSNAN